MKKLGQLSTVLAMLVILVVGTSPVLAQDPIPPGQDSEYQLMLEAVKEAARQGIIFSPEVADKLDLTVMERSENHAIVHVWQTDVSSGGAKVELEKTQDKWRVAMPEMMAAGVQAQAVSGYRLPFPGGMAVSLSQGYHYAHHAYDFNLPRGTPVVAAKSGTVVRTRFDQEEGSCSNNDPARANYVIIEHDNGEHSFYGHFLREASPPVDEGDYVLAGDLIGHVGNSGLHDPCWSGYHLHFQVQYSDDYFGSPNDQVNFVEVNNPSPSWSGESQNYGWVLVSKHADFQPPVDLLDLGYDYSLWDLSLLPWLDGTSMGDSISSIRVSPSYIVYLFLDHYFWGEMKTLNNINGVTLEDFQYETYDNSSISLNDSVSSILIYPRYGCTSGCTRAEPPGYGGGPEPTDPVPSPPAGSWDTKYWTNKYWAGDPSWVGWTSWDEDYPYVYMDWGPNPPVDGWNPDEWSSRFERDVYFPGGFYNFRCQSDDGCVLIVAGETLINMPNNGGDTTAHKTLSQGYHHVQVDHEDNAADAHLYLMWWGPGYVQFDHELPDGRIISPDDGYAYNHRVTLTGEAWDNQTWVDHITWYMWYQDSNGNSDWHWNGIDSDAPYSINWSDNIPDQTVWVRMDVVDANGNVYVMPSEKWVRIVRDTLPPYGSFIYPTQGQTVQVDNNILPLQVEAGDAGAGVKEVEFLAGYWNTDHTSWDWHTLGTDQDGSNGWSYDWNVAPFPDGKSFALWAWIRDKAGSTSSTTIGDVILDRLTPDEYVTVRWVTTSDGDGNPKSSFAPGETIVLTINGYNWSSSDVETLWTWDTRNPDGSHNDILSWDNSSVTMNPGEAVWFLTRQAPETTGTYTFIGRVTWNDGQYEDQQSTTFEVVGGPTQDSVQIIKVWTSDVCTLSAPEKTQFSPGETSRLIIQAKNLENSHVDTRWSWLVEYPDGSTENVHTDFPVSMRPGTNTWCSDPYSIPNTPGVYTFTGRVTWGGDRQYQDEKSTTFEVVADGPPPTLMPVWKALLLVYHNIDVDYVDNDDNPQHLTTTMPESEVLKGLWAFRQYASIAHDFSKGQAIIQYDVVHVSRPITSLTSMGDSYWISPSDSRQELDQYAPPGAYDSILVYWPQTDFSTGQQIPSFGWGWGMGPSSWSNGATYATVANAPDWMWERPTVGEPWLHEWLHGVCDYYSDQGYTMPAGGPDGASSHGYTWSSTTGWGDYYRDLMTGRVLENSTYTGISADAWQSGTILSYEANVVADYFYTNTISTYQQSGTVVWQSDQQNVSLGNSIPADNRLYAPVNFSYDFTVVGRAYIPSSGVGAYDTVAMALRNDQVEYWATLAYGTNLVERNHIAIMRNDSWGTLVPFALNPGWYTIKVMVDYQNEIIRMKAWADGDNEPDWQASRTLDSGWVVTDVGFRHYGQGTSVDDLFVIGTEGGGENKVFLPILLK